MTAAGISQESSAVCPGIALAFSHPLYSRGMFESCFQSVSLPYCTSRWNWTGEHVLLCSFQLLTSEREQQRRGLSWHLILTLTSFSEPPPCTRTEAQPRGQGRAGGPCPCEGAVLLTHRCQLPFRGSRTSLEPTRGFLHPTGVTFRAVRLSHLPRVAPQADV